MGQVVYFLVVLLVGAVLGYLASEWRMFRSGYPPPAPAAPCMAEVLQKLNALTQGQENLMALTQRETEALNGLATQVGELRNTITAAFQAATTGRDTDRQRIQELEGLRDTMQNQLTALQADDQADKDAISALKDQVGTLNTTIESLQADATTHETDVLGALSGISTSLGEVKTTVEGLGGSPA